MSIDYINGYLAGIAAQREAHDRYISHDYTLTTIDKQGKTVSETVKHKIVTTIEQFFAANKSWHYDQAKHEYLLAHEYALRESRDWKSDFAQGAGSWLHPGSSNPDRPTHLIDCFIDALESLLSSEPIRMYTLVGDIKSVLYYHWGGIGYQDFFFDYEQYVYHLHFDKCD